MAEKNRFIIVIILDLLTFVLMIIGITFSVFDVRFMVDLPRLSSLPIYMTFTGLSNIFLGLVCLWCAIYRLVKKDINIPRFLFVFKIVTLAEITITFVVTATYLSLSLGSNWWRLYINNNIFNHFLTPLVAIITFIVLEKRVEIPLKYCLFGVIPVVLYGIFYGANIIAHLSQEGKIDSTYDIYGFTRFGIGVLVLFSIGFLGISFALTCLYRWINNKKRN